jgi:4'-phosphopantetheinyl transferase
VHDARLNFSMAKSGDRLLIGFSSASAVGVDLEPVDRRPRRALGVAARYFSRAEAEGLAAMDQDRQDAAFLRTWACKEAVVKASGLGIANQLCRFTVETDPQRLPRVLDFDGGPADDWALVLLHPEPAFVGALAAHGPIDRVEARLLAPAPGPVP